MNCQNCGEPFPKNYKWAYVNCLRVCKECFDRISWRKKIKRNSVKWKRKNIKIENERNIHS